VIGMRALVVFESMYGNTRLIAGEIADGLRAGYEVTLVPVAGATAELVAGADLLVAGAPTHMHGLSSAASRQQAAQAAAKDSWLQMDPDAGGPGMQDWLQGIGHRDCLAAAFDTRVNGLAVLTGRASGRVAKVLKRHGYRLVAAPQRASWSARTARCSTARPRGPAGGARRWVRSARPMSRTRPRAPGGESGG
jgi:Flavodoxin